MEVFVFSAKDGEEIQTVAVQATTRLKQALTNEKEAGQRLNNQLDALEVCRMHCVGWKFVNLFYIMNWYSTFPYQL